MRAEQLAQSQLHLKEEDFEKAKISLEKKDQEIADLNTQVEQLNSLNEQLKSLQEDLSRKTQELSTANQDKVMLQQDKADCAENAKTLQQEIATLKEENSKLRDEARAKTANAPTSDTRNESPDVLPPIQTAKATDEIANDDGVDKNAKQVNTDQLQPPKQNAAASQPTDLDKVANLDAENEVLSDNRYRTSLDKVDQDAGPDTN